MTGEICNKTRLLQTNYDKKKKKNLLQKLMVKFGREIIKGVILHNLKKITQWVLKPTRLLTESFVLIFLIKVL